MVGEGVCKSQVNDETYVEVRAGSQSRAIPWGQRALDAT